MDGRLKVTGAARYAAEFAVPGLVHAVLVQSAVAAGGIAGFDLADAQGMPGVLAIITPDDAMKLPMKQGSDHAAALPFDDVKSELPDSARHSGYSVIKTLALECASSANCSGGESL